MSTTKSVEDLSIDTIRTLAMDAVQKANAGHPGTAMALAPLAYLLYRETMRVDPNDPQWPGRDRFVLSAGHACILQYAALHLTGFDLTLGDLESFRQWESRTPGHPELHHTPGVETTTGPLGQGVGNAIGMAIAERLLAQRFNTPEHAVVDHWTYAICSDGDVMEGVSGEASSIAGHLGVGKLIAFYDDNHITIEGDTALAFSEDVGTRYEAYGWHVQRFDDTWTLDAIREAIEAAKADPRPSLVILRTHIAYGAPNAQDTAEAHGAPLGEDEIRLTKRVYGWPEDAHFLVPDEVRAHCDRREEGAALHAAWDARMDAWRTAEPALAAEWDRVMAGRLPDGWQDALPTFAPADGPLATRAAGGKVLQSLAGAIPELVGGSADLAPSTSTLMKAFGAIERDGFDGRNFHFGIREHGMGAILNGAQMHGGLRVFGATFMIFSDYMRPAVRLAAIMGAPVVYVWTHDSVWLGEDGPTHQPVEHLMALRTIPNLVSIRPCDAAETAEAWRSALLRRDGPTALQLSRQGLPVLDRGGELAAAAGAARGAYVLAEAKGDLDAIVIASGSEVHDALAARETLHGDGIGVRVVSMPSWDLFELQDAAYRDEVLPPAVTARVSLEAGITFGWVRFVGARGRAIGIDRYGASAPGKVVARNLGISPEAVVAAVRELTRDA
jgi:transketolase